MSEQVVMDDVKDDEKVSDRMEASNMKQLQSQENRGSKQEENLTAVAYRGRELENVGRQRNIFMSMFFLAMGSLVLVSIKLVSLDERIVLVPGLNQEAWVSGDGVSSSYLEEVTTMYLPMLVDLDSTSIDWKRDRVLRHVSNSKESYLRELGAYFTRVKQQYEQFSLSTHFALKKLESSPKNLTVRAHGQLVSRFGDRGFESEPVSYGLSYEWVGGRLLLKEFVRLSKEDLAGV